MVLNLIFIISALFVSAISSYAQDVCVGILSPKPQLELKSTDGLITYLMALLENQVIGGEELLRLIQGLEKGELLNPISEEKTSISSIAQIHHEGIQRYFEDPSLNQGRLLEWAKQSLEEKKRVRGAREETRVDTLYRKIEFHPVPAGSFRMGEGRDRVKMILTHPFEMMSTAVTQKMWVELMGENPSYFVNGDQTRVVEINGKVIRMQPDHPVEQVTWWSVLEYANQLSLKAGLTPTYDFKGVKFKQGTSAQAGTLVVESGEVKINAPDGNIYLAEGYRLPTEAEREYVMRGAGRSKGRYHFGNNEADLENYAWYNANSKEKTHPVAELNPLVIQGKDFYDLYGNVQEWTQSWYEYPLKGGKDPQGPQTGKWRARRGGGWLCNAFEQKYATRFADEPFKSNDFVGFRLVRTIDSGMKKR